MIRLLIFIFSLQLVLPLYSNDGNDREYWVKTMLQIVDPVYDNLSNNTLRANMPIETVDGLNTGNTRKDVTHLEALGRSFCGIAPWLNLPADTSEEGIQRASYVDKVVRSIANAVNPQSPDYMPFDGPDYQPLVDAAFFAHGLLRSKDQVWTKLDNQTKERVIKEMKASRKIKPWMNNWLLFSAMIEAALLEFTGECKMEVIQTALDKHEEWYKGDGWYGDGPNLHLDYYNSYVIQPMLMDVLQVLKNKKYPVEEYYDIQLKRMVQYARHQELLIAPDATYPALGRSVAYRFGAFQVLAQVSLMKQYPSSVSPGQVRSALTAVMKRQLVSGTFDKDGWLTLGFAGHQPQMADGYISTGSAYLCTFVFLPLGLDPNDTFWTSPSQDWTSIKIWGGSKETKVIGAIRDEKPENIDLTN